VGGVPSPRSIAPRGEGTPPTTNNRLQTGSFIYNQAGASSGVSDPKQMKLHGHFILALLAVTSSTCFAELEFSGYIKFGEKSKFVLTDTERKKTSDWLNLGQSFEDSTPIAFDQKKEILSVRKGDLIVKLPLKPSHVRESKEGLADFRSFFGKQGAITAKDVEDRFGPPPRYSPLLLEDGEKDVTREHFWWWALL
jgi:hypothetical protein